MGVELEEFEPGRWRVRRERLSAPVSNLPRPHVISDAMPPTEQVDGRFYESKSAFRAVGRANGLVEVGNEKPKPRPRNSGSRAGKQQRINSIRKALEKAQL